MPQQPPFNQSPVFNTQLNPLDEMQFRQWVQSNNVPFNPNAVQSDYDMRGYWQAQKMGQPMGGATQLNANDGQQHYTDYFKTPIHQSFSSESQWANPNTPQWINDSQLAAPNGRIVFDEKNQTPLIAKILMGQ